jgi:ribulose-5-phosphate 4-epimerase/fuculose-1-phosphate aldolase
MAHEPLSPAADQSGSGSDLVKEALRQARIDLAACFREAARLGFEEGICNHFSALVPGRNDLFLVNPYGLAFREVTASSLLVCDFDGHVVEGDGKPEATAFFIHAQLHKRLPRARAAFHTHMPNATAMSMVEGKPLVWAGQGSLRFYGRTVVDEAYNGLALDVEEGDRIASSIGDADIVFLGNHGVVVLGPTIAEAWDDLYYVERACDVQIRAMSTGRALKAVDPDIAERTAAQFRVGNEESARLHLASIKRVLDHEMPEYRN